MTAMTSGMFSAVRDDWETPSDLFELLDREFHFTLDAASDDQNWKVSNHLTKDDNAILNEWRGRVFCNPPYGRNLRAWISKAYGEVRSGRAELVVLLLPSRTDTAWFHDFCLQGEIRFIRGRIQFGDSGDNAPFPSMIVVFRK